MLRENVAHLADAIHVRRGRGVRRKHYAAWPTKSGWIVMRDRWIQSSDAKEFTRDVQVFGPFPDRATALQVIPQ